MLYNYLKLYFRSFLKKKSISIVTIGGLALGMATSLLILGYISSELSFDRFHSNKDRIYRMIWEYGNKNYTTRLQPIAGERIKNEIASVEDAIRFFPQSATMTIDEGNSDPEVFKADEVLYVDPSFFQVFNFPVHNGDQNPFEDPYSMVMTRSAAKRYFEDEDPVGKRINLRNMFGSVDYTLTAVVEDIPDNSSIRFEILTTNERLFSDAVGYLGIQSWGAFDTFILTQSGDVDIQEIESTVKEMVDDMDSEYGSILFQPIEDIHLGSAFLNDGSRGMTRIYAFSSIA
ncbi:MAG: ABC transporter permease, partial [Cyclobacteriaceae bacterium]